MGLIDVVMGVIDRRMEKERRARKLNDEEIAKKVEVLMSFLDGAHFKGYVFRKEPIEMILESEDEETVDAIGRSLEARA